MALAVLGLRWNVTRLEVQGLEVLLLERAGVVSRDTERRLIAESGVVSGVILADARGADPRLLALQLRGPDGRIVAEAVDASQVATDGLPPWQPAAPWAWRVTAGLGFPPPLYVSDRPLADGRSLRLVYNGTTLQEAWQQKLWTTLVAIALVIVALGINYRLLLLRPLARIRGATDFASRLADNDEARLPDEPSGLREIDALRQGLNAAAEALQARRIELSAQRALLRTVVDADDAHLFLKDEQGRFVMANSAMLGYWRLTAAQMIGRTSIEVFGGGPAVQKSMDLDRRVWAGETPLVTDQQFLDGEHVVDFVVSRRIVTAPDGRPMLLGIARDVTAQLDLARHAEQQRAFTQSVIDLDHHFILVKDRALRYVLVNDAYARTQGRRVGDFMGRTPQELFAGNAGLDRVLAADHQVIETGEVLEQEEEVDLGAGRRCFLAVRHPITLPDGERGVLAVIRDVTEERTREASLRTAIARAESAVMARDRFLANVSHEIRTPINGMMGLTELALGSALSAQQREWLQLSRASAQTLLAIVNDLLDVSKIDARGMAMERTPFDLHALLVQALRPMAMRATAKGLVFLQSIEPGVPESFEGDPTRVRQVLVNLVGNAIKFTESGSVAVRVDRADGGRVRIRVEDTGPGIEASMQAAVFEPFVQGDATTTRRFGGTGLGLTICRELVELMGGRLELESAPGRGSCFSFLLPASSHDSRPFASLAGRRLVWLASRQAAPQSELRWLQAWGAEVLVATALHEALAWSEQAVDTLLIDESIDPGVFIDMVQAWRSRGHLLRVVAIGPAGGEANAVSRVASRLPSARGLAMASLMRPFTPREFHDALVSSAIAVPARPAPPEQRLLGWRVLLVEDNDVNSLVADAVLTHLGASVRIARHGAQALTDLQEASFDVVLMDIQMPELDGMEVVARWRAIERERGVPASAVIAMTAHAMAGDRERFIAAGFSGYVGKPFTQQSLLDEIARVGPRAMSAYPDR